MIINLVSTMLSVRILESGWFVVCGVLKQFNIMNRNFTKAYAKGEIIACVPRHRYTVKINGDLVDIPYAQIHSPNLAYPGELLSSDGLSLKSGAVIDLVGIEREGEPVSWRPAHESYLKTEEARVEETEAEAREVYFELLQSATERGLVSSTLSQSVRQLAQGSAISAVILLKIFLGIPVSLK